jgi:hypothetical protein
MLWSYISDQKKTPFNSSSHTLTRTHNPKEPWLSIYPHHANTWIYFPPKWWQRRVGSRYQRGGEWKIFVYEIDWTGKYDLAVLIDRILGDIKEGHLDYLLWEDMDGVRVIKWAHRRCVTYTFKFKTVEDACIFKLTYLA